MWVHKTEEPEEQEVVLGTTPARLHKIDEPRMAFSVTLGYRPGFDDVWQDGDDVQVDREPPRACVYIIRHEHGAAPLGEGPNATDGVRVWIPLDYDGETFPTAADVENHEWEALLGEAGFKWPEFNRCRTGLAAWVHTVSALLRAAGVVV